jgi:hypothetical protein
VSTPEVSSTREHRTTYIVVGVVLAVLLVVALVSYSSAKSTEAADQKADQLIAAFEKAGAHPPAKDHLVRVFGDDGGAVCDNPDEALRKAIFFDQLTNGAAGPGMRPVIADRRVVRGQLIIMGVYCPDDLPKLQELVDKLKTADTVKS